MENQHQIHIRWYDNGSVSVHAKKDNPPLDWYYAQADKCDCKSLVFEYARQRKLLRVEVLMTGLSKSKANEYKQVVALTHKAQGRNVINLT